MATPFIHLNKRDTLIIAGAQYAWSGRDKEGLLLVSIASDVTHKKTFEELWNLYFDGTLRIERAALAMLDANTKEKLNRSLESFSKRQIQVATMRLDYVQGLIYCLDRHGFKMVREHYERAIRLVGAVRVLKQVRQPGGSVRSFTTEKLCWSTLRDWHWRYRDSGNKLQALIPSDDKKGPQGAKIDPELIGIIAHYIREHWLINEAPPISAIKELIDREVDERNKHRVTKLVAPSESTIRRWKDNNVTEFEEVFYREGKEVAEQKFRHVHRAPETNIPCEFVEMDHTPLDLLILLPDGTIAEGDRRKGKKKKKTARLWLTVAICCATRMIVGWHLSMQTPNWMSIMHCLRMMAFPKEPEKYGAEAEYPVIALPSVLRTDNGKEFHSKTYTLTCAQLGIQPKYMPRGKANMKGKVERYNGTVARDFLAFMGGRTFRDIRERGHYDSEGRACFYAYDVEYLFGRWVIDIYHQRPHGSLWGRSPLMQWRTMEDIAPRLPPSVQDLHMMLGLKMEGTIQNEGIEYLGLHFQSTELQAIRKQNSFFVGKKYSFTVNPMNLGQIIVLDEEKEDWVVVPSAYPELSDGVSLLEWRMVVELARKLTREGDPVGRRILLKARHDIVEEARKRAVPRERMTENDLSWFNNHYGAPVFNVSPSVEGELPGLTPVRFEITAERRAASGAVAGEILPPQKALPAPPKSETFESKELSSASNSEDDEIPDVDFGWTVTKKE